MGTTGAGKSTFTNGFSGLNINIVEDDNLGEIKINGDGIAE
jgi:hypothetical protein